MSAEPIKVTVSDPEFSYGEHAEFSQPAPLPGTRVGERMTEHTAGWQDSSGVTYPHDHRTVVAPPEEEPRDG